jgi:hypothetical protein
MSLLLFWKNNKRMQVPHHLEICSQSAHYVCHMRAIPHTARNRTAQFPHAFGKMRLAQREKGEEKGDKKKGTDLFTPTPSEKVYDLKVSKIGDVAYAKSWASGIT